MGLVVCLAAPFLCLAVPFLCLAVPFRPPSTPALVLGAAEL
jgi:hypothetical protein